MALEGDLGVLGVGRHRREHQLGVVVLALAAVLLAGLFAGARTRTRPVVTTAATSATSATSATGAYLGDPLVGVVVVLLGATIVAW